MRILYWAILAALLSACKSSQPRLATRPDQKATSPATERFAFRYLTAKSTMVIRQGDKEMNTNADLRIVQDSAIWLSLRASVGVEGLRALLTRDSIFVYNRLEDSRIAWSMDSLARRTGVPLDYAMIQDLLIGNLPLLLAQDTQTKEEGELFVLERLLQATGGPVLIAADVDRYWRKAIELRAESQADARGVEVSYDQFRTLNRQLFPFLVSGILSLPQDGGLLNIEWTLTHQEVNLPPVTPKMPYSRK